jgi:hypothetical protein
LANRFLRVGQFGEGIREDLKAFVFATPGSLAMMVDADFTDDDDNDDDDDDIMGGDPLWMDDFESSLAHEMPGDGDSHHEHAPHGFPRIALTRNNLTALSQRYNVRILLCWSSVVACGRHLER